VKQLSARDKEAHSKCHHQLLALLTGIPNLLLLMTDESHLNLNGTSNKQNFRYWSDYNPHELHEHKVTVWCGVLAVGITGPYFEIMYRQAVTVTAECYKDMLETFLTPCLQMLQGHEYMWFQCDGDTTGSKNFHGCALWVVSAVTNFSL
jgi:hypothetical protein